MASLNKVQLIGRLGKAPDARSMPNGTSVTSFSIATDESYKNKSGEKVERTEWHRIETLGPLAEICAKYLSKGKLVYIEGKLHTRKWDDKDGVSHTVTEVIANAMQMLERAAETEEPPVE